MIILEDLKNSLRISHNEDDVVLQRDIDTAKAYIIAAIDSTLTEDDLKDYKQFDYGVSLLAEWFYLNRGETTSVPVPTGVTSMIQQLRGAIYATD
ncbi:head-tail connector protein [Paucilactobacillus nenjiangensis]|jgi:uncharacterized phage protein (predicted DNA packaging)|uniref:head-tail connector protein n=1 Tax=Paucilactobacillus nenjiangensis TaxID=1296540 RepID=UPI0010F76122|nr:head-tail connector protein [Paucilactobacillus nenjiangensis]